MFNADTLEELYESLYYGLGLAEMGITGVILIATIIGAIIGTIISMLVAIVIWLVEAIPTYKLAQKLGYKLAILAWIPVCGSYFRLYVLAAMVGEKPFVLFDGKVKMQNRTLTFWVYVLVALFGGTIISIAIAILGVLPVIGAIIATVSALLYFIPPVVTGMIQYAFLRDVLDCFKEDKKSNRTAAIVISVLDSIVTFGLARAIYLWTIMKKDPLPQQTIEAEQVAAAE